MAQIWYVAHLILKCDVAGEPTEPDEWTCIEQIHAIRASDREMAYEKAMAIGKEHEQIYKNSLGQDVSWTFVGLEDLQELLSKSIRDGTEVWGRVFYTNSPNDLVVDKDHLWVFYHDQIAHLTAAEILEDEPETKLVCNRVKND